MDKLRRFIISLLFLVVIVPGYAQDVKADELFQVLLQHKLMRVYLMNDYVSYMADKSKSHETRYYYRTKALPLFIGKSYEYEENGVTKRGVMMQTTSVNRPGVVTNTLLRDYFSRLVNLRYSKVNITSTEIAGMKVSDLKKVDSSDNKTLYMCTCQYVEYYRFDGGLDRCDNAYVEKSTKRIVCYVELDEVEIDATGKPTCEYTILLGDVESISTERL